MRGRTVLHLLRLIGAALALVAGAAFAQGELRDCVNQPCTIVCDPFPVEGQQPTGVRLYDGATLIAEAPLVDGACRFERVFASGIYSLTARAFNASEESAPSNVVALRSVALGPPAGGSFT